MIIDKRRIATRFAEAVATYDDEATGQRRAAETLIALLKKHLDPTPGAVLEIGCGTGMLSRLLLAAFAPRRLYLNDLCPAMRECVGDILGPSVSFEPGDAECRRFAPGMDLIVSSSAVQWFADPAAFVARCRGLLVPGGSLALGTFGPRNLREIADVAGVGLAYPDLDAWRRVLNGGWEIVELFDEMIELAFDSPVALLRHFRRTGVTGVSDGGWTAGRVRRFCADYIRLYSRGNTVVLTYNPLYLVARTIADQRT